MNQITRLASVLRFLSEGSYQHGVGKDFDAPMAQSTFSGILKSTLAVLQARLCPHWVNLNMTDEEKQKAKRHFYTKYRLPGVILCVDGTHIKIVSPKEDIFLFYNRKGFFSINAMIICDSEMRIRYVNAEFPGCNHDSHIWNVSSARSFCERKYLEGERNCLLLGDAGYALEPWLMTPFRSPQLGSPESVYNKAHSKARNIVERTIGVLKSRFRCLFGARELHYEPSKVSQIVNVAAALHNICLHYRVIDDVPEYVPEPLSLSEAHETAATSTNEAASQIRQSILMTLL
ncbi:PREDICTED: putative nuclease HARBI1 isoform X1 [Rhagoletis zephyria]|uniref:putative nuclease HARBI1 isoform X1 n=2 Tax=Rhagoletis zephyria TaxID=28612 RepID=UPI0008119CD0|nr:PREDICTED: putative nuclease HARBI1 isoform X1 [Rhagoletis zephyria]XP_017476479.1 PREDICTED: putative nuclease HARBI1 isoform X1 [Rhagoletis zephyria]